MPTNMTDGDLLLRLEPAVEENLRRHLDEAEDWHPHDFAPWDEGKNFAFLGGEDWSPEQSHLSDVEILSATVGVLVADNLPAYHRELARALTGLGAWWKWTGRWTSEENRQAIVLRDYLVLTRAVDPVALERVRMEEMTRGYSAPSLHVLDIVAHFAIDESAAALRNTNTVALGGDKVLATILTKIAADDVLQSRFYANIVTEGFGVVPDQTMRAVADRINGYAIPVVDLPSKANSTEALKEAGIYDDDQQREKVFKPLLATWNVFGRDDLGDEGKKARDELAHLA
ncbi:acyl-ACP desaturase [Rhodococcus sp. BP-252]|uniref:acyl-ACP desaturase n=1 Tax=unclassified Rhodococcus (in: high G+C Gram-positive bacteria) TaxID=192944 RepID=UPI000DF424A3|nr:MULTISPECIES: acyl-ACP desaturase [unclassified Rhodococcus (in: high G+C Gram-positive bacteria)]MBY6411730.1 acyl-ACP desaturase [Rhodococcus sp. BP-320]MBY6417285.1 acyl-ACP desaturase [Rhodococcus sp. BP-321]MBY6421930.1 acyl-ACP desaturase [Rhodococcus sp. BP-324]MBY6427309.1 acyl-ACP desaturase [Rhodococcus sp. BP-323]MBY6432548.1 acyl-ACP desaturase [Rhodococcus sp. BP-322]